MDTAHPNHNYISSNDVEGTSVYDTYGNKIGGIDHLMINKATGQIAYAVMSFGGFLGLAHKHYPLPWGALSYAKDLAGFITHVTEKQLSDAPAFSDDSWHDRQWEERMHNYYNVVPYY